MNAMRMAFGMALFTACAFGGDLGKKPLFIGIVDRCKGDVAAAEKTFVDNVIETGNVPLVFPRTTDATAVDALHQLVHAAAERAQPA